MLRYCVCFFLGMLRYRVRIQVFTIIFGPNETSFQM